LKCNVKLFLAALFLFALLVLFFRLLAGEDAWICQNGEWVKHGNSSAQKPATPCGNSKTKSDQSDNEAKVDTSSWIPYRNTAYGFEMKYPPENWKVDAVKGEDPNTSPTPRFDHLCKFDVYCGGVEFMRFKIGTTQILSWKIISLFWI